MQHGLEDSKNMYVFYYKHSQCVVVWSNEKKSVHCLISWKVTSYRMRFLIPSITLPYWENSSNSKYI